MISERRFKMAASWSWHRAKCPTRETFGLSIGGDVPEPAKGPASTAKKTAITCIDNHHRRDYLPLNGRQRRINPKPTRNPESEGDIMLIHLLTCLALTAFTLSVFSWYVLSEEQTS
ncbi:hypothetical protein KW849_25365 [Pseudomonas sp. PDM26]|uniref:hypothetical protein n=1 Tax=Pseudomonas sp. PDM26 TaxID=2854766 RepID=UPI001C44538D|nr:hypothetical protein [Pseudomonas sp. PDM26]MBV7549615.1 hypothetical protein [Pseudomonas sp. PDM26]